jgi:hypothetical protein
VTLLLALAFLNRTKTKSESMLMLNCAIVIWAKHQNGNIPPLPCLVIWAKHQNGNIPPLPCLW